MWLAILMAGSWLVVTPVMDLGPSQTQGNLLAQAGPEAATKATPQEEARAQKGQGDQLMRTGKTKEAEAAYRKACELDPSWYEAYEALGNLLFSAGRYPDAIAVFHKAVKAEPRYLTGLYNIAFAHRKAKEYEKAADFYQKYLAQKPDDPDAYYGLAATFEAMGKTAEAVKNYETYAEKETRPTERQYVAKAKQRAEELKKSLAPKAAVAAVGTGPTTDGAATAGADTGPGAEVVGREPVARPDVAVQATDPGQEAQQAIIEGKQAAKRKDYNEAERHFEKALQLDPKSVDATYRLGLIAKAKGQMDQAQSRWKRVLELEPGHTRARQALAQFESAPSRPDPRSDPALGPAVATKSAAQWVADADAHAKKKNWPMAIAGYREAVKIAPREEEGWFKLGLSHAAAGDLRDAVASWDKVLEINPRNVSAKRNVEKARKQLGDSGAKARTAPAPKVRAEPVASATPAEDLDSLMIEGRKAKAKGDARGVVAAMDRALGQRADPQALILRGEAQVKLKQFEKAKKDFSRAMELDPNLATPFYGLGEVYRLQGDMARAKYYYGIYMRSTGSDTSPDSVERARSYLQ